MMSKPSTERKQHQMPVYLSSPAGWFLDPWDLTGESAQERWWTGLIWSERTRKIDKPADRDKVSFTNMKENPPC